MNDCIPENQKSQLEKVKNMLMDFSWHSKYEIAEKTGIELSSTASRIRDLRLQKFGGYEVERMKSKNNNVYYYRIKNQIGQGVLF
jgi:hypothetical protein